MTSPDPQADRRDDDSREHRTLGQKIRDAVLGEPDPDASAERGHSPGHEPERADVGRGYGGRGHTGQEGGTAVSPAGYSAPEHTREERPGVGRSGTGLPPGYSDAAHTRGESGDAPSGQAPYEHVRGGAVPDPVRDDVTQDGTARDEAARTAPAAGGGGPDFVTSSYDPDRDTGYDPQAAGTAVAGSGTAAGGGTPDFVTSSYDPDRDAGYDPQAAGTALADAPGGRTDVRDHDARGYDPSTDVGYVDEARAGTDRTTGHRDVDYDTGRVDTGPGDTGPEARGASGVGASAAHTSSADTSAADTSSGRGAPEGGAAAGGLAAGTAVAGAAVAAGVAAVRHRDAGDRDTGDRDTGDRDTGYAETGYQDTAYRDDDARFSAVDDTVAVDAASTGRAAPAGGGAAGRAEAVADEADEAGRSERRERLVPADRAREYTARWDALKGDFVDEPRRAVAQADGLVGELLDEIQRLFTDQRRDLERGLDHDQATTEDLRLALRRYRSFFDRLLSF